MEQTLNAVAFAEAFGMDSTTALTLAFVLIGTGFVLLVAEVVLYPGGILGMTALVAWGIGILLGFNHDPSTGFLMLLAVAVGGGLLLYLWFKTPLGRQMVLRGSEADGTLAETEMNQELERLVGRFGRTVSSLRPSGIADFDGRRVDVITEGIMVEPGQSVRCIEVKAGRVVVRPAEKPGLSNLENASFD